MILNLIIKDIKVYWKTISTWYLFWLVMNSSIITTIDNETWIPYISIGCIQISIAIGIYFFKDRTSKGEILICSLPVLRHTIIRAKYITSGGIALVGLVVWLLNAVMLNSVFITTPHDFYLFHSPYVLLIVILYFTVFISVFLPLAAGYLKSWKVVVILLIGAFFFVKAFRFVAPRIHDFTIEPGSVLFVITAILIVIAAPYISLNLSVKMYNSIDL